MAKRCQVTGKGPVTINRVSHSNKKTKVRALPNLRAKRFWLESERRWVRLQVSARALRTITKRGIEEVVAEMRSRGEKI